MSINLDQILWTKVSIDLDQLLWTMKAQGRHFEDVSHRPSAYSSLWPKLAEKGWRYIITNYPRHEQVEWLQTSPSGQVICGRTGFDRAILYFSREEDLVLFKLFFE